MSARGQVVGDVFMMFWFLQMAGVSGTLRPRAGRDGKEGDDQETGERGDVEGGHGD